MNKATCNSFLQEFYILECSKKYKLNITLIKPVFETVNPNICKFQWPENIFLRITFAVQYFNQKTSNDTSISHFLSENIQDNINTFDGNSIDFFVKLYTHERPGNVQSNPIHHSIKKSKVGKKNVKRYPKQSDLHSSLNF